LFLERPVRIPEVPGKISYKKAGDRRYVQFVTGRRYDKIRKYTLPDRSVIGIQIPARPEYMIPNENYFRLFSGGETEMDEIKQEDLTEFEEEREEMLMVRDFFEQMYYEFQYQGRKQPNTVLNQYKVESLNQVLEPLRDMMKDEPAGKYLELIPLPVEKETEDGGRIMYGMTYSDVMMVLTKYRCAEGEYFQKWLIG